MSAIHNFLIEWSELMKTLFLVSAIVMLSVDASGAIIIPVDFSSQANWTWAGYESVPDQPSGVFLPGAPTGMTNLGGIPFDIKSNDAGYQAWNSYVAANEGSGQVSLTMNVDIYGATNVYTLINTFWGGPNSYASLILSDANGDTYTKSFVGYVDTRDVEGNNSFNGTTTTNVFSGTYIDGVTGVLDMQNIVLPSAFANQTLTSIELVDNGSPGVERAVLDGVTVETASVPEPSAFVSLFGAGLAGLIIFACRRFQNRSMQIAD
jgi:hypothetical protein